MTGIRLAHFGKWQTAHWVSGLDGGDRYCDVVVESLDKTRELFERTMSKSVGNVDLYAAAERLHDLCEEKQGRYAQDIFLGTKKPMRGRGEPGRTPFNYPDYRHRFSKVSDLFGFFDRKDALHQECLLLLGKLIAAFPEDEDELCEELHKHSHSMLKWTIRRIDAVNNPNEFLLPLPTQTPLELMNIGWLHRKGCFGYGVEATLAEAFGPDKGHPALAGVFVEDGPGQATDTAAIERSAHATAIVGIISARFNLENSHVGGAPLARIGTVELAQGWGNPLSEIVNFSGTFCDRYWETMQDEEYHLFSLERVRPALKAELTRIAQISDGDLQNQILQHLYESLQQRLRRRYEVLAANKLLIQANGNEGVLIDQNPSIGIRESYAIHDSQFSDLCIRAVNVQPNGLHPHPTATLPGARFADSSVCAVGTDVLTTTSGGGYKIVTGSSAAAPFVTSVAILLRGAFPELSIEQIRWCILEGATPIVLDDNFEPHLVESQEDLQNYSPEAIEMSRLFFGRGLLNGKRAYELAQEIAPSRSH